MVIPGIGNISSKKLGAAGRVIVSAVLVLYLLSLVDGQEVLRISRSAKKPLLGVAPALLLLGLLVGSVRWSQILRSFGIELPIAFAFRYYLIGHFYGVLLPGVVGGDVIRVTLARHRHGRGLGKIATSTLMERVMGLITTVCLGSIGVLSLSDEIRSTIGEDISRTVHVVAAAALVGLALSFAVLRLLPLSSTEDTRASRIGGFIRGTIRDLKSFPIPVLISALLLSAVFQSLDIVTTFILARAIDVRLDLSVFFVVVPVVYIATLIPISVGGLGVRESVLSFLLARLFVPTSAAVILAFLVYLNRVVVGAVGGLLQLKGVGLRGRETEPPMS